jgi:hypothetical protein
LSYPYTLNDTFRSYDQLIYEWLDKLKINYGSLGGVPRTNFGILRCFATPRRAFATMEEMLIRKNWLDSSSPEDGSGSGNKVTSSYQRIPLPFCSIERTDYTIDKSRFSTGEFIVYSNNGYTSNKYRFPFPIDLSYKLEFWCKQRFTVMHILEWVISQLSPKGMGQSEMLFRITPIDHNGNTPYGSKTVPFVMDTFTDNSDIEPGENQRNLRLTFIFTLKAWLFYPPISTDGRYGMLNGPLDVVSQSNIPSLDIKEFVTTMEINTDIKRQDNNKPYCTGELFDTYSEYGFNYINIENVQLENNSELSKYVITEDNEIKFYPKSSNDFLYFNLRPLLPETYFMGGLYYSFGDVTIKILSKEDILLDSFILDSVDEPTLFNYDFINEENELEIRIFSDQRLTLKNLYFKRSTHSYQSNSSISSFSSVSSYSSI